MTNKGLGLSYLSWLTTLLAGFVIGQSLRVSDWITGVVSVVTLVLCTVQIMIRSSSDRKRGDVS